MVPRPSGVQVCSAPRGKLAYATYKPVYWQTGGAGQTVKNKKNEKKIIMDSPAFFFTFFLWFLLLSATGYSVYVSFGPPSKKLRDPFEEHED